MVKARKKIFLLLAGGTWLLDKNQHLLSVQEPADILDWLNALPELAIMADLEPIFINSEETVLSPATWEKMAQVILAKQDAANGFIVVSRADQLNFTASALAFLLPNFSKNIILTASYLSGLDWQKDREHLAKVKAKHSGLGLKTNLINAIQTLDNRLPQPAIMFGTRLLPGLRAVFEPNNDLNLFASIDNNYWGRVDFGVNIKSNLPSYKASVPNFNKMQANILLLENVIGLPYLFSKTDFKKYQAVLIKGEAGSVLEKNKLEQIKKWPLPVVFYNFDNLNNQNGILSINNCSWPVALIKTMWLAANVKSLVEFEKLLNKNLIGEYENIFLQSASQQ